jgi:phospholipid transport system transporter-binding protein
MSGVQDVRPAGETQLIFEPVLDIAGVRYLYSKLDGALTGAKALVLDASRVQRIDTAALQLLAAFCRATRDAGLSLRWHAASAALCDAAALLGLNKTLGRPE